MTRYWIGVASKDHVRQGVLGGFSQLCHGKVQPLRRMAVGDWTVYYSPKMAFGATEPCQMFTAPGEVKGEQTYQVEMFPGFRPYRRDIHFLQAKDIPIQPMLGQLSFIKDKSKWGYAFRFGHIEIPLVDWQLIATAMLDACATLPPSCDSQINLRPEINQPLKYSTLKTTKND